MQKNIDNILPNGKWIFDEAVTNCFDNMIQRSIPDYQNMRELVFDVGKYFVQPDTAILDLGCSTGLALEPFVNRFYESNHFIGIEVSDSMFSAVCNKYEKEIMDGKMKFIHADLQTTFPDCTASVILSILTLQFIPYEHRLKILKSAYKSLVSKGCLILVEKLVSDTDAIEDCFTELYYGMKKKHGYTEEQIQRKRISLECVMQPVSAFQNEDLLKQAGFKKIECFWRHLNFAGWVAIKE